MTRENKCSACLWKNGWAVESKKREEISNRGTSVHEDVKGPCVLQYGWVVNWLEGEVEKIVGARS